MNGQTSAELEREAERTRAEVNDTAERLRGKLTPGQLLDEVRDYMSHGDSAVTLDNLKNQVRDNPLALALIGSGLAWLMLGEGVKHRAADLGSYAGRRYDDYGRSHYDDDMRYGAVSDPWDEPERYRDTSPGMGERMSSMAHGTMDSASGMASGMRDSVAGMASSAGSAASSAGHSISDAMHGAAHRAGSLGSDMRRRGMHAASGARHTFSDMLEREPLIVGALGLAVGAAIGALLPTSRIEEEQLGETSADLRNRAGAMAEAAWDEAAEAVSHTAAAVRDAADKEGLSTDTLAEKAGRVADAAAQAVEEEVDRIGRTGGERSPA